MYDISMYDILAHLTKESPVCYRSYSDATLEHRAVGEDQDRGKKSTVSLQNKNIAALKICWVRNSIYFMWLLMC